MNSSPPLLAWIVVLLLSVGLNIYGLATGYRPRSAAPASSAATSRFVHSAALEADEDDEDTEEDDTSWLALSEELRQTRRQLAECQGRTPTSAHRIVSQ
ncbi:hypothetical protein LGH70_12710 [Hymenobacter sp. BT635]|uniref:Uncharacterized protein n=1 Tax=Hymenobacter nitidus TaxID=2880929 RepID=A0ABS8ADG7_9BACT|nr:hypothetical protein [Hymenobacter nitidus]MCB2378453.1 hypothetical protein [Hymenobacter nitidus]